MTVTRSKKTWLTNVGVPIVAVFLFGLAFFALSRQAPAGPVLTVYESPT
jgi:hypothetical protein